MGTFVAYGYKGLRMASADGQSWSKPVLAPGREKYYFQSVTHGAGQFIALGREGGRAVFAASADGKSWSKSNKIEVKDGRLVDLAHGNGLYLAIGGHMDGHWTTVSTSKGGEKWSTPKKFDKEKLLMRVTFGRGQFVAVGIKGRVAVSKDGSKWTDAEPLPELDTFVSIAYGNGVYVGAGLHGLRMHSADGLAWTGRQVGEEGEHINSILWTGKQFVGVGLGATFFSPDGKSWKRVPNRDAPTQCAYGNGLFVGSKWKGRILVSKDAVKWMQATRAPEHINGVCFG